MFYILEESDNRLTASFLDAKLQVSLSPETNIEGVVSATVNAPNILKESQKVFPHGEDKDAAVAEAEQFFRNLVNAIAADNPLNLTDFSLATSAKKKTATPPTEKQSPPETPKQS